MKNLPDAEFRLLAPFFVADNASSCSFLRRGDSDPHFQQIGFHGTEGESRYPNVQSTHSCFASTLRGW